MGALSCASQDFMNLNPTMQAFVMKRKIVPQLQWDLNCTWIPAILNDDAEIT